MFHLIGMFTWTARAFASSLILSPSFCHMMKSCLDEECMRHGGSWLAFKKKKTGNESYQHRSCFSTVCVCGCHMHGKSVYLCL